MPGIKGVCPLIVIDMSTTTFDQLGPVLVSELPPVAPVPTLWARVRTFVEARVAEARFERALRLASPAEHTDLLAAARRD
jgi:hypothetical protein